ncbi:hypothetical protein NDU88_007137 [Pleurodeles waltl]|uniref:Uncharacterized protein n=1 Tax=Pleurodeles waltl TaxID=8319 RepID=A0AAV7QM34_PLEWA|nr:hypothetical protein NDU88_007137 [Pleurodeles waltl]
MEVPESVQIRNMGCHLSGRHDDHCQERNILWFHKVPIADDTEDDMYLEGQGLNAYDLRSPTPEADHRRVCISVELLRAAFLGSAATCEFAGLVGRIPEDRLMRCTHKTKVTGSGLVKTKL